MRIAWTFAIVFLWSSFAPPAASPASGPATLRALRQKFVGQKVVVGGIGASKEPSALIQWELVQAGSDGRYTGTPGYLDELAASYRGKVATVIAVQINRLHLQEQHANAMGETVGDDDVVDPYVDVVVKFDDGVVAMTTQYGGMLGEPGLIPHSAPFILASASADRAALISKSISSVIGKKLYAVHDSGLFSADATLEEVIAANHDKRLHDVPLLQPLLIIKAKYLERDDTIVLGLRLPSGLEALVASSYEGPENDELGSDAASRDHSFLGRIAGSLESRIPQRLSPREIKAIQSGDIFRGMSHDAVVYLLGSPWSNNDWGSGGRQLVYHNDDGDSFVYVDEHERVVDWQFLNR